MNSIIITGLCCLTLISITLIIISFIKYKMIIIDRRKWDELLLRYIDIAYEAIYTKYILPFVTSKVTFPIDGKDKYFLEASQSFLHVLNQNLGKNKYIYYKIYMSKENFTDIVLSLFIARIQEDMVNQVVKQNIQLTLNENEQTLNSSEG